MGNCYAPYFTSLIIALGITALVGILTSIDAIKYSLTGEFALLGANTFSIQNRGPNIQIGRGGKRPKTYPKCTFYQAQEFKENFNDQPALVSLSYIATGVAEVEHQNKKTNPNMTVWAADENYLQTGGYEMAAGRNFSITEVENGAPVALIGQEVKSELFVK
ncbi:MAG: ABC transporter permease [Owenweeksia sp.]|nr:ABC transporter permease [Owenweeksia sp.]